MGPVQLHQAKKPQQASINVFVYFVPLFLLRDKFFRNYMQVNRYIRVLGKYVLLISSPALLQGFDIESTGSLDITPHHYIHVQPKTSQSEIFNSFVYPIKHEVHQFKFQIQREFQKRRHATTLIIKINRSVHRKNMSYIVGISEVTLANKMIKHHKRNHVRIYALCHVHNQNLASAKISSSNFPTAADTVQESTTHFSLTKHLLQLKNLISLFRWQHIDLFGSETHNLLQECLLQFRSQLHNHKAWIIYLRKKSTPLIPKMGAKTTESKNRLPVLVEEADYWGPPDCQMTVVVLESGPLEADLLCFQEGQVSNGILYLFAWSFRLD